MRAYKWRALPPLSPPHRFVMYYVEKKCYLFDIKSHPPLEFASFVSDAAVKKYTMVARGSCLELGGPGPGSMHQPIG